jgi:C4-dicarboxylate-specific signal transduction histidine kinase
MEGHGNIALSTNSREDNIVFTINDDGCGIPLAIQKKLFQPFTTTKKMGLGLGLFISRLIIESYGGNIGYEKSQTQTQFVIKFPIQNNNDEM